MLNISLLLLACDLCRTQSALLCTCAVVSSEGRHCGWPKALLWATQWQRTNFISDTHNIMFVPGSGSGDFHSLGKNGQQTPILFAVMKLNWHGDEMMPPLKLSESHSGGNHLALTRGKDVKNVRWEKHLQLSCRFTPRLLNRKMKTP